MLRTILIGAAVLLLAVATVSIYMALQRADVLAWLATAAVSAIASAVLPSLAKRKPPEAEARDHQDVREGIERTATGRERER